MSDFDDYRRPRRPPANGIKMQKSGTTWWGRRWIEALERSERYRLRLARGRSYARAGRTHDLEIAPGRVTAKVTGSDRRPYEVSIEIATFGRQIWRAAIAEMANEAAFAAELLDGRMPERIDEAFDRAGVDLFPEGDGDLAAECTCPDAANPCKHIAATHYVLGEAFDRDPFLLFELRGRTKAKVLAELGRARGAASEKESTPIASVKLDRMTRADYRAYRGELPVLSFDFEPAAEPAVALGQLGLPHGWAGVETPRDLLSPMICAAADRAAALADADPRRKPD
jgi:uncharacterized Zn finger protein